MELYDVLKILSTFQIERHLSYFLFSYQEETGQFTVNWIAIWVLGDVLITISLKQDRTRCCLCKHARYKTLKRVGLVFTKTLGNRGDAAPFF